MLEKWNDGVLGIGFQSLIGMNLFLHRDNEANKGTLSQDDGQQDDESRVVENNLVVHHLVNLFGFGLS